MRKAKKNLILFLKQINKNMQKIKEVMVRIIKEGENVKRII